MPLPRHDSRGAGGEVGILHGTSIPHTSYDLAGVPAWQVRGPSPSVTRAQPLPVVGGGADNGGCDVTPVSCPHPRQRKDHYRKPKWHPPGTTAVARGTGGAVDFITTPAMPAPCRERPWSGWILGDAGDARSVTCSPRRSCLDGGEGLPAAAGRSPPGLCALGAQAGERGGKGGREWKSEWVGSCACDVRDTYAPPTTRPAKHTGELLSRGPVAHRKSARVSTRGEPVRLRPGPPTRRGL